MSSGFVSGGISNPDDGHKVNPEPSERDPWTKAEEAIKTARWQQEENNSKLRSGEEKSLYEILQANKARKQEEFEEKLKFKHQFKPLDEDDVEYLDSILSEQARTEQLRKQELESQLDQFRRAQYEAENAGNAEALESIPTVEEIVPGGWNAGTRKRKKPTVNESSSSGLKIRKMSTTAGMKSKDSAAQQTDNIRSEKIENETKNEKEDVTSESRSANVDNSPQKEPVKEVPGGDTDSSGPKVAGLLGLVSYSSDDDDD